MDERMLYDYYTEKNNATQEGVSIFGLKFRQQIIQELLLLLV